MDIIEFIDSPVLLGPHFRGDSWDRWRAVLKAAYALPMTAPDLALFREVAGDREPPAHQASELWCPVGRGGGKDSIASAIAAHVAVSVDYRSRLRPGEKATVLLLACDRAQAGIVFKYIKGYFEEIPLLAATVEHIGPDSIELTTGAEIIVATNSYRSVRGRTVVCAIYDEIAFWRDDNYSNPDTEVDAAIDPGLMRWPGSIKIAISTVYRRQGLLYQRWRDYFGKSDDDILVVSGASRLFNPTLLQSRIDRKMVEDAASASAEYYCIWRDDISSFVSRDVVERSVVPGRVELPPMAGISYQAFFDAAGGDASAGGGDSMALSIGHRTSAGLLVIDAVREVRPPFTPASAIDEFCVLLKSYQVHTVIGDHWAGGFPPEQFAGRGITYRRAKKPKSDIYGDFLPLLNSGLVELLDNPRMIAQLLSLERRTAWGGKDSIDHPKGAVWHDDLINVVAGLGVGLAGGAVNDDYMTTWTICGGDVTREQAERIVATMNGAPAEVAPGFIPSPSKVRPVPALPALPAVKPEPVATEPAPAPVAPPPAPPPPPVNLLSRQDFAAQMQVYGRVKQAYFNPAKNCLEWK